MPISALIGVIRLIYKRSDTGVYLMITKRQDYRHPVLSYGKGNEFADLGFFKDEAAMIKFCAILEHLLDIKRDDDGNLIPWEKENETT